MMIFSLSFCQEKVQVVAKDNNNILKKTLMLIPAVEGKYYNNFTKDSTNLKDGKYTFNISKAVLNFPKPFQLSFEIVKNKSYGGTDMFFLPSINNVISFDSTTGKVMQNQNEKMVKESKALSVFLKPIEIENTKFNKIKQLSYKKNGYNNLLMKTIDSLAPDYKKLLLKENKSLLTYSKKNPNSLALFWKIVQKISRNEYDPIFNIIYNNFSAKIKNSEYGKILNQDLNNRSKLEVGNQFPEMSFGNNNISSVFGTKYTLVDFWFSYCQPCIEAMPKYKTLYADYKGRGFEIIGISSDRTQDIANWKNTVEKYRLVWKNFHDKNKMETTKYNINSFPTTFLLNADGKIIKKNISPEELNVFLKENLH